MLAPEIIAEVKRFLGLGTLSQRQISRRTGVSRSTIRKIAGGKRKERVPKTKEPWETAATGKIGRCPICGAKVKLPCLYCIIRKRIRIDIETNTFPDVELQLKPEHKKRYEQVRKWRELYGDPDAELPEDWPFRKQERWEPRRQFR